MPLFLLLLPVCATLAGGLLAVRFRRHLALLLAAGVGLLLGAASLDLLPEATALGAGIGLGVVSILLLTLAAAAFFHGLERLTDWLMRGWASARMEQRVIGRVTAAMLIFHSFRDGLAIGAAFASSHPAGYAVACGVAAHDLGDGMNTVLLTTAGERPRWPDYLFLAADAVAPMCGMLLTSWWSVSARFSVVLLVLAAGFFLHMAMLDFLPQILRSQTPRRYLVASLLTGSGVICVANSLLAMRR